MRVRELSWKGLTVYTGPAARLDFDAWPEGVVSFVGKNGSGKTTALEAIVALLWLTFPSRKKGKSLYDYANDRGAYIEGVFEDRGQEIRCRVNLDAQARKAEAFAWLDGEAVARGKLAEYSSFVAERFGSLPLFLASIFAAQNGRGNLLEVPRAERRALFAELLDLGRLERLHLYAKSSWNLALGRRGAARAEFDALVDGPDALPLAQEALAGAEDRARDLGEIHRAALDLVEARRAEAAAAQAADQERQRLGDRHAAALSRAEAARFHADRVRQEAARAREDLEARLREARAAEGEDLEAKEEARHAEARRPWREKADAAVLLLAKEGEILAAVEELGRVRQELGAIEDRGRRLRELDTQAARAERAALDATAVRDRLAENREIRLASLRKRTELKAGAPCAKADTWIAEPVERVGGVNLAGTCPLLADARAAEGELADFAAGGPKAEILDAVRNLDAAERQHRAATEALERVRILAEGDRERAALLAARRDDLAAIVARGELMEGARGDRARARQELDALERRHAEALEAARAERERRETATRYLVERLEELADTWRQQTEEARQAFEAANEEAAAAARDLQAAAEKGGQAREKTEAWERAKEAAERERVKAFDAAAELGRARARVEDLERRAAKAAELRPGVVQAEGDAGEWGLLVEALGPEGVQSLILEASGPAIAELTNELLRATWGGRFAVSFRTLREKRDGTMAEDFQIRVLDDGQERDVEDLSGGERVVIGEGIALALAIYNARRSGVRWEVLFRDETAGALDPDEAAPAYVAMLRRARQVGGFRQVVFVAHLPGVYEAADVRVFFDRGRIGA